MSKVTIQRSWREILQMSDKRTVDSDDEQFNIPFADLRAILQTQNGCESVDIENFEE